MKRITLFCGHYGSGKTNLAVNFAFDMAKKGLPVTIADLDIVNPYFRSKDSEEELKAAGIKVISLPFANSSVDLPSLPSEAYALVQDKTRYAVLDIGGDDRGAYALGRFVPSILEENNYEMLYVVNFFRPLTSNVEDAVQVLREIELACGIRFTGIVNNSNLGAETTRENVESTAVLAHELGRAVGIPVVATTAQAGIAGKNMIPLHLQKRIFDEE